MTNWKLLGDRVLIKPDPPETVTEGGTIIPEIAIMTPPEGIVILVGPGYDKPMLVKEGNRVSYGPSAGTPVIINKEEFLMMRELEIFMYE